jgi:hypothetical protein
VPDSASAVPTDEARGTLRQAGAILLISCYELGHQPLGVASPLGFLERAGYTPDALDISVESFDPARVASARLIGVSVPMHTALRLGVRVAGRIRQINPACHICFYGLYASLNAEYLLEHVADSVIGANSKRRSLHWRRRWRRLPSLMSMVSASGITASARS